MLEHFEKDFSKKKNIFFLKKKMHDMHASSVHAQWLARVCVYVHTWVHGHAEWRDGYPVLGSPKTGSKRRSDLIGLYRPKTVVLGPRRVTKQ